MKKILIVDDEAGFTRLMKLTLEKTGDYQVLEVNDGTQGWIKAREFRPDLVLLDIVMPTIDGGDVAAQIKSDPALSEVPIVFLTAIVSKREADSSSLIGGFPFISKPVRLDALVECIEQHLGERS